MKNLAIQTPNDKEFIKQIIGAGTAGGTRNPHMSQRFDRIPLLANILVPEGKEVQQPDTQPKVFTYKVVVKAMNLFEFMDNVLSLANSGCVMDVSAPHSIFNRPFSVGMLSTTAVQQTAIVKTTPISVKPQVKPQQDPQEKQETVESIDVDALKTTQEAIAEELGENASKPTAHTVESLQELKVGQLRDIAKTVSDLKFNKKDDLILHILELQEEGKL